jgi:hypothetical protein
MGWLFGKKKKVPRIPFPEGQGIDKNALQFSSPSSKERVIEPEQIKEAVGIEQPLAFPLPEEQIKAPEMRNSPSQELEHTLSQNGIEPKLPIMNLQIESDEPLFIKVDVYQEILTKMDELKLDFSHLKHTNNQLQQSEFNEVNSFEKLRKSIKNIHDKLLLVDKTLFK